MTFEKCWEVLPLPVQMLQYDVSKERHLPWAVEHIFAWGARKVQHNVPVNVFHRAHLEMAAVYEAVVRSVVDCFCFSTFSTRTATSLCTNYFYNVSPERLYAFRRDWLVCAWFDGKLPLKHHNTHPGLLYLKYSLRYWNGREKWETIAGLKVSGLRLNACFKATIGQLWKHSAQCSGHPSRPSCCCHYPFYYITRSALWCHHHDTELTDYTHIITILILFQNLKLSTTCWSTVEWCDVAVYTSLFKQHKGIRLF